MAKEKVTFKQLTEDLTENMQTFVRSNLKVVQLEIYERTTNIIASGINLAVIAILVLLILFFVNIGVAQLIGEHLEKQSLGYLIVAGFYLLLLVFYLLAKKIRTKKKIRDSILKNISKTHTSVAALIAEQQQTKEEIEQAKASIRENVSALKVKIYGEEEDSEQTKEEQASVLPKPLLINGFDFVFRRYIFKKDSFLKNKMSPLVAELLVTSLIYGEGKIRKLSKLIHNYFTKNQEDE